MTTINMTPPGDRDRGRGRRSSGSPAQRGPTRTIDADGDSYRQLSLDGSDNLFNRLKVAAALDRVPVRELVLRVVIPEIDRVYREHGLES